MQYQPIRALPDLAPVDLPPHPRVFVTGESVQRCRSLSERAVWAGTAMSRLLEAADAPCEWGDPVCPDHGTEMLNHAFRQILAFHLTGRGSYRDSALAAFRRVAEAYLRWPLVDDHTRGAAYGLGESRFTIALARVYDLLAAEDLAVKEAELKAVLDRVAALQVEVRATDYSMSRLSWCRTGYTFVISGQNRWRIY